MVRNFDAEIAKARDEVAAAKCEAFRREAMRRGTWVVQDYIQMEAWPRALASLRSPRAR